MKSAIAYEQIMCKKLKLHMVEEPKPMPKPNPAKSPGKPRFSDDADPTPSRSTDRIGVFSSSFASTSSGISFASLKQSVLPDKPILFKFKEITEATAQFTAGRLGKSSVYKSNLRGKTVAITVRKLKNVRDFMSRLAQICNIHHSNLVKLLGGCYEGDHVYLVYDYVQGSSLADCLRNSRVPAFTILKTWMSRMQIAIDIAQGLEYMHHDASMNYVHNYLKSSSIIITEPDYRAIICHAGACYLTGEYEFEDIKKGYDISKDTSISGEITEEGGPISGDQGKKVDKRFRSMRITGTQGYMSPEYVNTGIVSQKNDVFAFGVILLELLTGNEPVKYVSKANNKIERVSLIESMDRIFLSNDQADRMQRLRLWMDPRLKDSFPVDCAERVVRLAAACVDSEPEKRHDMRYVAGKLSKEFIRSQQWSDKMQHNKEFITSTLEGR